jgi:small subunit ribosomal protein S6
MRYYETLYILNPNFEQEKNDDIIKEVGEQINKSSQVINHRLWGKKRLAYSIELHKYGTYMLLQFETDEMKGLEDFDNFMKLNKSILRFQTVRLSVKPEVFVEEIVEDADAKEENEIPIVEELEKENKPITPEKQSEEKQSSDNKTENDESKEKSDEESIIEETS